MNFYYDIILNWDENTNYNFYEWNDTDCLELIKKIPLFKVKNKTILDMLSNNIKVSKIFLDLIKEKTLISGNNLVNKIEYAAIFTDAKNGVALEFNQEGITISRSNLLVEDELNVLDVAYSMKETTLTYDILEKVETKHDLRQEKEAKHIMEVELDSLYEKKELNKLKYLYYEYKKIECDNIEEIYQDLKQELNRPLNKDILKLYYIIKLSYHNV